MHPHRAGSGTAAHQRFVKTLLRRTVTAALLAATLAGTPGLAHARAVTDDPSPSGYLDVPARAASAATTNRQIRLVAGEPKNANQYRKMFAAVPTTEWGGGDVTISTRLSDGRRLWLHGDTLSLNNGFVHSTALVQTGSVLNVANDGRQILPNDEQQPTDGTQRIYWVETVKALPNSMAVVTAAPITVTPNDPWGFSRFNAKSRQALLHVDSAGDIQFVRWTKWVTRPDIGMDGEDLRAIGPNHYSYAVFVHDIRLKNGMFLRTSNQNWSDGMDAHVNPDGTFRYEDWRPMFGQSRTRVKPYWGR